MDRIGFANFNLIFGSAHFVLMCVILRHHSSCILTSEPSTLNKGYNSSRVTFRPLNDYLLFGSFFENYECSPTFWATSFHSMGYESILAQNGFGYILGDFFANSSGHPECKTPGYLFHTRFTKSFQSFSCFALQD
jgi:hypothetical protein